MVHVLGVNEVLLEHIVIGSPIAFLHLLPCRPTIGFLE